MVDPTLFIHAGDRLGPDVLAAARSNLFDPHVIPHAAQGLSHHVAALVDLDHNGVGLVRIVQVDRPTRPFERAARHGRIFEDVGFLALGVDGSNNDAVFVAVLIVAYRWVNRHHDAAKGIILPNPARLDLAIGPERVRNVPEDFAP